MRTDDTNIGYSVLHKSMSVVVAPWLSVGDMGGQYGMRCDICRMGDEKGARYLCSHLIWALPGRMDCAQIVGTRQYEIWTEKGLVEHMREAHEDVENEPKK
jgi:hypothetical protein